MESAMIQDGVRYIFNMDSTRVYTEAIGWSATLLIVVAICIAAVIITKNVCAIIFNVKALDEYCDEIYAKCPAVRCTRRFGHDGPHATDTPQWGESNGQ